MVITVTDLRWAMNRLPVARDYPRETYSVPLQGGRFVHFRKDLDNDTWVLDPNNEPLEAP